MLIKMRKIIGQIWLPKLEHKVYSEYRDNQSTIRVTFIWNKFIKMWFVFSQMCKIAILKQIKTFILRLTC